MGIILLLLLVGKRSFKLMRIVYISSSTIPSRTANSIHVMKMCQAFAKNGNEVVLISRDNKNELEPGIEDVYSFYGVEKCFAIVKIPWLNILGRGYIYGFLCAIKARNFKPDLVYCRNFFGCYFAAILGLMVIMEFHSPIDNSNILLKWLFDRLVLLPNLKKIVVITNSLKNYFKTNHPKIRCKIQVAPDGADPISEKIKPIKLLRKSNKLQAGYIGHLYKGRGVSLIISLAEKCPWADFHLVGGTERDILYWKTKISDFSNIYIHGFVSPKTDRFRCSMDVLLAPYQYKVSVAGVRGDTARWMSPLKIFEYMASCKPILSSDLTVLREILVHDRNALLCKPNDVDEWKMWMENLRDNPNLGKRLGKEAYYDFINNYTWTIRAKLLCL